MKNLLLKSAFKFLQLPIMLALFVFLPAGTFDYWQGWVFSGVFTLCSLIVTAYLAITDPKLLERRLDAGPRAEKEPTQKVIMAFAMICFAALVIVSALDHRFGWSDVPTSVVLAGNLLIVLSFAAVTRVMRENTFSASTIQIAEDHKVISTGPYAHVRHPMYSGALLMLIGFPLALGSWWGLLLLIPTIGGIVWRLLDEEQFLKKNLPGYTDYTQKVRYRLLPGIW